MNASVGSPRACAAIGVLTAWMQDADVVITPLTWPDQVVTGPSGRGEGGGGPAAEVFFRCAKGVVAHQIKHDKIRC